MARRPITIWDNSVWKDGWRSPHEQHDIAEFLQCLTESCPWMLDGKLGPESMGC